MSEVPAVPVALPKSAYGVCEAQNAEGTQGLPGHLYFFVKPDFPDTVPDQQEEARKQLEDIAMRLRIAFQKDEPSLFSEFFQRLLYTALATFSPSGFRMQAMNDLPTIKRELVQTAGGRIKARYNLRLVKAVFIASVLLSGMGLAIEWAAGFASNSGSTNEKSFPTQATESGTGTKDPEPMRSESQSNQSIGRFVRWDEKFSFSHTGFLMAASMWGLLFASMTRNLDPTFETLLTPDADLMEPWVRLLFFGIPILIVALVFQTQIVAVSLATVSTATIGENVVAAILFGLLLGVAERALPQEVVQLSRKILPSSQTAQ